MLICELLEDDDGSNSRRIDAMRMLIAARFKAEVLPDSNSWKNKFRIKSSSSPKTYVIAQNVNDNTWACGCPGWTTRRRCKHLTAMLPSLQKAFG